MTVTLTIDPTRLQRFIRAVGGPGDRLLRRKTERVAQRARELASVHGSMAEGIESEVVDGKGIVRSTNPHTLFIIHGTRPHLIRPKATRHGPFRRGGSPSLRFTVGGRVVYAKLVRHPGTRADDFLTRALREAG